MSKLDELLTRLPEGAVITRRPYSWAVELPNSRGYFSCGVLLENALEHALEGMADAEMNSLRLIAELLK